MIVPTLSSFNFLRFKDCSFETKSSQQNWGETFSLTHEESYYGLFFSAYKWASGKQKWTNKEVEKCSPIEDSEWQ